jgi:Leucine-rich repeat (LRR) protein
MFLKIAPVSEALSSLKLGSSSVTDNALKTELPKMTKLKKLDLSQTQIGDETLDTIGDIEGLEWLNLWGTQVTDLGLMKLKDLSKLRKIYLWQSKVTEKGAAALKKELPDLEVIF